MTNIDSTFCKIVVCFPLHHKLLDNKMKFRRMLIITLAPIMILGCSNTVKEGLQTNLEVISNYQKMVKSSFNWDGIKQGWQTNLEVLGISKTKSQGTKDLNSCSELLIKAHASGMSYNKMNKLIRDNGC